MLLHTIDLGHYKSKGVLNDEEKASMVGYVSYGDGNRFISGLWE